jgi:hypothetical protein
VCFRATVAGCVSLFAKESFMEWLLRSTEPFLSAFESLGIDAMDVLAVGPIGSLLYGITSFGMSSHLTWNVVRTSLAWTCFGLVWTVFHFCCCS